MLPANDSDALRATEPSDRGDANPEPHPRGSIGSRAARGAGNLFVGNAVSLLISGIGTIAIARLLGATNFGLYAIVLIPSATAYVFTQLGLGVAVSRYVAFYSSQEKLQEAREFVGVGLTFFLLTHIAIAAASFALAPYIVGSALHYPQLASLAEIASVNIVFQALTNFAVGTLSGFFRTGLASAVIVLQACVKTGFSIGLILAGLGTTGAVYGLIVGYAASGVFGLGLLFMGRVSRPSDFRPKLRTILAFSLPNYAANLLNGLTRQGQLIILAALIPIGLATSSALGAYSASLNLIAFMTILSFPLSTIMLPTFSVISANKSPEGISHSYLRALKVSNILITPAGFFLIALSRPVFDVFYGHSYYSYFTILTVLALGYLVVGMGSQVQGSFFSGLNNNIVNTKMAVVSSLTVVALSLGLGFEYGVWGVAAATTAGIITQTIYAHYSVVKRHYRAALPARPLLSVYLASISACAVAYLVGLNFKVVGLAGAGILTLLILLYVFAYVTAAGLLGSVSDTDANLILESTSGLPVINKVVTALVIYYKNLTRWRLAHLQKSGSPQGAG